MFPMPTDGSCSTSSTSLSIWAERWTMFGRRRTESSQVKETIVYRERFHAAIYLHLADLDLYPDALKSPHTKA